jgi:hypothetical protein
LRLATINFRPEDPQPGRSERGNFFFSCSLSAPTFSLPLPFPPSRALREVVTIRRRKIVTRTFAREVLVLSERPASIKCGSAFSVVKVSVDQTVIYMAWAIMPTIPNTPLS